MVKKTQASLYGSVNNSFVDLRPEAEILRSNASESLPERPKETQKSFAPEDYTKPFIDFISNNPTVFHAVAYFKKALSAKGYEPLSERESWNKKVKAGGKYYVTRNESSIIAFSIGADYQPGNGAAIVGGHVDALTAKLKPVSKLQTKAGFNQLGVAPYGGALNMTWWDRDLGIGGKVVIKGSDGKFQTKLVKLDWPIARVPTLAVHFGAASQPPFNAETQAVPIIGLDNSDVTGTAASSDASSKIEAGTFAATQPERLVRAIAGEMGVSDYSSIVSWELELFDIQPAQVGGLDKEFIFAGRIDDKLCSYAAFEALIASPDSESSDIIKMACGWDFEEIGSLERAGARGNFLGTVLARTCEATAAEADVAAGADLHSQLLANSFLVSSDVCHAVHPNFLNQYLENHAPRLNVGVVASWDPNGHMTTNSISSSLLRAVAEKCGSTVQVFQIRNDSRSGGTIGPMTSAHLGIRAIDAGIPQLSMHSIRATTGSLDPGLGVQLFKGFFDYYSEVDAQFKH